MPDANNMYQTNLLKVIYNLTEVLRLSHQCHIVKTGLEKLHQ